MRTATFLRSSGTVLLLLRQARRWALTLRSGGSSSASLQSSTASSQPPVPAHSAGHSATQSKSASLHSCPGPGSGAGPRSLHGQASQPEDNAVAALEAEIQDGLDSPHRESSVFSFNFTNGAPDALAPETPAFPGSQPARSTSARRGRWTAQPPLQAQRSPGSSLQWEPRRRPQPGGTPEGSRQRALRLLRRPKEAGEQARPLAQQDPAQRCGHPQARLSGLGCLLWTCFIGVATDVAE